MPHQFDDAVAADPIGDGLYRTDIEDGWDIGGNANGGYLMALLANAMRSESGRAHPVSVTTHYLAPAPAGGATTRCEVVKAGRRLATVTGSLVRDGREIVRSIGTFGDIDSAAGVMSVRATPPELPDFDECRPRSEAPSLPTLMRRLDMRIHPDDTGFGRGEPTGEARIRGYFAFADGRAVDTLALLLAADAFPPVMFNLFGVQGWVPTVEFTVHVRGIPAPGPVACIFTNRVVQGGMWEEDGEIWDSSGTCVAMSRQLALAPLAQNE